MKSNRKKMGFVELEESKVNKGGRNKKPTTNPPPPPQGQFPFPYGEGFGMTAYRTIDPKGVWDSKIDTDYVRECGNMDKKITIGISPYLRWKINTLMKIFQNMEWLGYLVRAFNNEGYDYYFTDMLLPHQVVTPTRVDNLDDKKGALSTPYVMHSHGINSCLSSFSHIDDDYININNDVSILVTGKEISAEARTKTPCGKYIRILNDDIKISIEEKKDPTKLTVWKEFISDIKEKIKVHYVEVKKITHKVDIYSYKKNWKSSSDSFTFEKKSKKDEIIKKEISEDDEIEAEIEEFEKELEEQEKSGISSFDSMKYCDRHHLHYSKQENQCAQCEREKNVIGTWEANTEVNSDVSREEEVEACVNIIKDELDLIETYGIDIMRNSVGTIEREVELLKQLKGSSR